MIQVTEDYYQIPVMMDGQMTQLNMFFMKDNSQIDTSVEGVKVLMSFSTNTMGRVQAMVNVRGNQASLYIQSEHPEDRALLQKVEGTFVQVLEASNFTLGDISYEPFEVKEPIEFIKRDQKPFNRTNTKGHVDLAI